MFVLDNLEYANVFISKVSSESQNSTISIGSSCQELMTFDFLVSTRVINHLELGLIEPHQQHLVL